MNFKKVFLLLLFFLPCSYFGILVLLIYSDPFEYCSSKPLHKGADSRDYCPIIARSHDYNFAVLGTSMSANMSCSLIDSELQVHSLKMIMIAGSIQDLSQLINYCLETGKADTILCDFHFYSFTRFLSYNRILFPQLYDSNCKSYKNPFPLMNFSHLFAIFRRLSSKEVTRDELFRIKYNPGLKAIQSYFNNPKEQPILDLSQALNAFDLTLKANIEKYPKKIFIFYLPPFSILFYTKSDLKDQLIFRDEIARRLLQYPNVRLYDFQTAQEITHNLDIYSDLTHYNARTNNWIIRQIAAGNYLIRNDSELLKASEVLRKQAQSYDFDAAYERIRNAE